VKYVIRFQVGRPRVDGAVYSRSEPHSTVAYERIVEATTSSEAVAAAVVEFAGRRIVEVAVKLEDGK